MFNTSLFLVSFLLSLILSGQLLNLNSSYWQTLPLNFNLENEDWTLDFYFPQEDSINYLYTKLSDDLSTKDLKSVFLYGEIQTQDASFNYLLEPENTCVNSASFRPFFWTRNLYGEFDRWFTSSGIELKNGASEVFSLEVDFDPSLWSSVYGKSGSDYEYEFRSALKNIEYVGIVFGGGCFFGHGIRLSQGQAKFKLVEYMIIYEREEDFYERPQNSEELAPL